MCLQVTATLFALNKIRATPGSMSYPGMVELWSAGPPQAGSDTLQVLPQHKYKQANKHILRFSVVNILVLFMSTSFNPASSTCPGIFPCSF